MFEFCDLSRLKKSKVSCLVGSETVIVGICVYMWEECGSECGEWKEVCL